METIKLMLLIWMMTSMASCNKETESENQETTTTTEQTTNYDYPIVGTGQSNFYDNAQIISAPAAGSDYYGQNATYAGNEPKYTDNGDGTISDNVTGLMWQKSPDFNDDGTIDYNDKLSYYQAIDSAITCRTGGYDDWRLPTIKELYSLVLFSGAEPSPTATTQGSSVPYINTNYFNFGYGDLTVGERIIDAQYASSSIYVSTTMHGNKTMFGFNFADGRIKGYPTDFSPLLGSNDANRFYIKYVRNNKNYGKNNFVDNGDGTISDKSTGLMWMKDDSKTGMIWKDALSYAENYESAGFTDWRLPDAKELNSIVDYSRSPETTNSAAIDAVFNCTSIINEGGVADFPFYWSSTTFCSQSQSKGNSAVYFSFGRALGKMNGAWLDVHGAGAQRSDPKAGNANPDGFGPQGDVIRVYNYVRLVRKI